MSSLVLEALRLAAAIAALGWALTPAAAAAPPWSEPTLVGSARGEVFKPAISFGGDGSAFVSWHANVVTGSRPPRKHVVRYARYAADGTFVARGRLRARSSAASNTMPPLRGVMSGIRDAPR